jgi:beta-lactamase regulating signal transducer with metallopeptidase domain
MAWQILAWRWLAHAAVGGLFVLALGSLAAWRCRQPVHRAGVAVLTLLAALAVPWVGELGLVPRWSVGALPSPQWAEGRGVTPAVADGMSPSRSRPGMLQPDAVDGRPTSATPVALSAPIDANTRQASMVQALRSIALPWHLIVLGVYATGAAGLFAWWLAGQVVLRRVTRSARPVPAPVRDLFLSISGPAGATVVLLRSDRITLPFTYTWVHPVIVLPASLCDGHDPRALRFCLAHEWSHVERRDIWAWNLAALAGLVLFYQPLFWWLRRQLRLCQDYLADDRAAALGSAEDYAAFLVGLARDRLSAPAMGIGDRRSNLSRRIVMLVQDHGPLEHRCRTLWSLAAAAVVTAVMVVAAGLRLDAAPAGDEPRSKDRKPALADSKRAGGRTWTCQVIDKETRRPIAGASVLVKFWDLNEPRTGTIRTLAETHVTTGADGRFQFTVTAEEAANAGLRVWLEVNCPDHVGEGTGSSYGGILRNEALGERPSFETIELWPGKAIEGRVVTPDGKPATGIKVESFSIPVQNNLFKQRRFVEARTDARGRFRLVIHARGQAVLWINPERYVPSTYVLKDDKRGDLGTFTLVPGISIRGRVRDAEGKPVGGIYVAASRSEGSRIKDDLVLRSLADHIQRAVVTADDGTFTVGPFSPGPYRVVPDVLGWDPATWESGKIRKRRPLPAVFTPHAVTLEEEKTPEPVEIKATPHVVVEAQMFDSQGKKRSGQEIALGGTFFGLSGSFFGLGHRDLWSGRCEPTADGAYKILAPRGLERAEIRLITDEHSALRFRLSKDAPLRHDRAIVLGTLDHDVKGIEIIRYEAPIILLKATTKDGKPVKGFRVSADYTEPDPQHEGKFILKGGVGSDVNLEEQGDGRYRSSQLVPDREVKVTAQADGFKPASRKLKLPEGKTEEVTLVLEPK